MEWFIGVEPFWDSRIKEHHRKWMVYKGHSISHSLPIAPARFSASGFPARGIATGGNSDLGGTLQDFVYPQYPQSTTVASIDQSREWIPWDPSNLACELPKKRKFHSCPCGLFALFVGDNESRGWDPSIPSKNCFTDFQTNMVWKTNKSPCLGILSTVSSLISRKQNGQASGTHRCPTKPTRPGHLQWMVAKSINRTT